MSTMETLIDYNNDGKDKNLAFIIGITSSMLLDTARDVSSYILSDTAKHTVGSTTIFVACGFLLTVYALITEPFISIVVESHTLRYKIQGYCVRLIESLLNSMYSRAFIFEITGAEEIDSEALGVILSNHQGFLDYLTILNLSKKCGIDNSNFFFVWKHCVRLPSIQVLYNAWRKKTNWRVPQIVLPEIFSSVLESPWKDKGGKWVTIFPEVTPWNPTTMLEHRAECVNNGCPKLENLLYPRFNAFLQTIGFLRDHSRTDVYDITIIYINTKDGYKVSVPNWLDILFSNHGWKINVSIKRTSVMQLPQKEKNLSRWLEKQWFLKDEAITEHKNRITALHSAEVEARGQ